MYEVWRRQAFADLLAQGEARREAEHRRGQAETDARLAHAEKLASIGRVTAAVAHEINNPLSYLGMNLRFIGEELQQPGHNREEVGRALADSLDGVSRIAELVVRLRSYARADADAPEIGATDLGAALDRAVKLAEPHTRGRTAVRSELDRMPPARGLERALVQVFVNLIVNAAQALSEERASANQIAIQARRSGEWLAVEVHDNGPGIPREVLPRIGEPFFTTKPPGRGMGLGLFLARAVVEAVGGTLDIESVAGEGTSVRVTLPTDVSQGIEPAQRPRESIASGILSRTA
jgi:signal transduction histidine kinase